MTVHAGTNPDGSMSFTPSNVKAREGDKISLTVVNDDADKPHDWALLSYGGKDIEVYTREGETKTITFTASEAGDFRIVCQIVGHKQAGMVGTFSVAKASIIPSPTLGLFVVALAATAIMLTKRRR